MMLAKLFVLPYLVRIMREQIDSSRQLSVSAMVFSSATIGYSDGQKVEILMSTITYSELTTCENIPPILHRLYAILIGASPI